MKPTGTDLRTQFLKIAETVITPFLEKTKTDLAQRHIKSGVFSRSHDNCEEIWLNIYLALWPDNRPTTNVMAPQFLVTCYLNGKDFDGHPIQKPVEVYGYDMNLDEENLFDIAEITEPFLAEQFNKTMKPGALTATVTHTEDGLNDHAKLRRTPTIRDGFDDM
jgi:hypothetical protein